MNKDEVILAANRIEYLVEALTTMLESKNVEILIPVYFQDTKENLEKNFNIVDKYLMEHHIDILVIYEDDLYTAFQDGPDAGEWPDYWRDYQGYVEDLEVGIKVLRNIMKKIWPTSYNAD